MAEQQKTVRELAAALIAAQDAYRAAYCKTLDLTLSAEQRIDALLDADAASKALFDARIALDRAQQQVAA